VDIEDLVDAIDQVTGIFKCLVFVTVWRRWGVAFSESRDICKMQLSQELAFVLVGAE
jgi:hypothetical protein